MAKELMVNVDTGICVWCNHRGNLDVPVIGYTNWRKGMFIQDALPNLSDDAREQLISGTHGACFDEMFEDAEEDDDFEFEGS